MKFIGAHVSIGGGVENAPLNASKIGARAFGMFTKNQRQWAARPLTADSIRAFRQSCEEHRKGHARGGDVNQATSRPSTLPGQIPSASLWLHHSLLQTARLP